MSRLIWNTSLAIRRARTKVRAHCISHLSFPCLWLYIQLDLGHKSQTTWKSKEKLKQANTNQDKHEFYTFIFGDIIHLYNETSEVFFYIFKQKKIKVKKILETFLWMWYVIPFWWIIQLDNHTILKIKNSIFIVFHKNQNTQKIILRWWESNTTLNDTCFRCGPSDVECFSGPE